MSPSYPFFLSVFPLLVYLDPLSLHDFVYLFFAHREAFTIYSLRIVTTRSLSFLFSAITISYYTISSLFTAVFHSDFCFCRRLSTLSGQRSVMYTTYYHAIVIRHWEWVGPRWYSSLSPLLLIILSHCWALIVLLHACTQYLWEPHYLRHSHCDIVCVISRERNATYVIRSTERETVRSC